MKKHAKSKVTPASIRQLAQDPNQAKMDQLIDLMEHGNLSKDLFKVTALAYAEALMKYYNPLNEQEEDQFTLAHLLWRNENRMVDLERILEKGEQNEREMRVSKAVHDAVLDQNPDKQDDWQYEWSHDFYICMAPRAEEVNEHAYLEKWIPTAEKILSETKYANMPEEFWELWRDDATKDDDEDECDEEECEDDENCDR